MCGIDVLWKCHSVLVQKGGKNWEKGELRWGSKGMVSWSEGGSKVIPRSRFSTSLNQMTQGARTRLGTSRG